MSRPVFLLQWKLHQHVLQCAFKSSFFCINVGSHYESGDSTAMTTGTRIMRLVLHKLQGDG